MVRLSSGSFDPFFFFNDTATTEIYTLSLHDALPIYRCGWNCCSGQRERDHAFLLWQHHRRHLPGNADRKSTRLNSSHGYISYAVFCLKKKKKTTEQHTRQYTHDTSPHSTERRAPASR